MKELVAVVLLLLVMSSQGLANPTADQVKAAYVYKFTQFAIWPDAFFDANNPIKICVLGDNGISQYLQPLNSKSLSAEIIDIAIYSSVSETLACRIVYISDSQHSSLDDILLLYKDQSILTVSSIENFANKGGMIGFIHEGRRVRLEINNINARRAKIRLNAKLLEVAYLIDDRVEMQEILVTKPSLNLPEEIPVNIPKSARKLIEEVQP